MGTATTYGGGDGAALFGAALLMGLVGTVMQPAPPAWAADALTVTPNPVQFGSVPVDLTREASVTVTNPSPTAPVEVTGVRLVAAPPDTFGVVRDGCTKTTLPAKGECVVRVSFRPTDVMTYTASLTLEAAAGKTVVSITGDGVRPAPSPTTLPTPTTAPTATTRPASATTQPPTSAPTTPTTSLPSPVPTTVPPSARDKAERCEEMAQTAKIAYAPTQKMVVDKTTRVQVTAAVDDDGVPTSVVSIPGTTIVVQRALHCEVQALLRGIDFRIEPPDYRLRSFLDEPVVSWSWDVVPLKTGHLELTLEIRSRAIVDDRIYDSATAGEYLATITVDTKPETWLATIKRWSKDVVEHPLVQGFGSLALVAGTLAAAWRRLLKRPWPWQRRTVVARDGTSGGSAEAQPEEALSGR